MVERCHRTLQSVIVKVMEQQGNWYKLLNSVLFGMCCYTHSSTGFSAMRMLYNKDPIMPFEMADKLQHENCNQESEKSNGTEQLSEDTCTDESDKIFDFVQTMSKE